jgi:hypothetical protein
MAQAIKRGDLTQLKLSENETAMLTSLLAMVDTRGPIGQALFGITKTLIIDAEAPVVDFKFEDVSSEDEYLINVQEWTDREH